LPQATQPHRFLSTFRSRAFSLPMVRLDQLLAYMVLKHIEI
jgi:hypothetical protein